MAPKQPEPQPPRPATRRLWGLVLLRLLLLAALALLLYWFMA